MITATIIKNMSDSSVKKSYPVDKFDRQAIYNCLARSSARQVAIEDILPSGTAKPIENSDNSRNTPKSERIDFEAQKLQLVLFFANPKSVLKFKSDDNPESTPENLKILNILLLFITSQRECQYHFRYFLDQENNLVRIFELRDRFLNCIVREIKALSPLNIKKRLWIRFNGWLNIEVFDGSVTDVNADLANFKRIFDLDKKKCHYEILVKDSLRPKKSVIFYSGDIRYTEEDIKNQGKKNADRKCEDGTLAQQILLWSPMNEDGLQ